MSDTNDDPVLAYLRDRKATLESIMADALARLAEVDDLIAKLGDGRSRVRRRIKEVAPAGGAVQAWVPSGNMAPEPPEAA